MKLEKPSLNLSFHHGCMIIVEWECYLQKERTLEVKIILWFLDRYYVRTTSRERER